LKVELGLTLRWNCLEYDQMDTSYAFTGKHGKIVEFANLSKLERVDLVITMGRLKWLEIVRINMMLIGSSIRQQWS